MGGRDPDDWTWHRFPTESYGHEVIAGLREDGLFFSAQSAEQARFLRGLGGRAAQQFVGDLDPRELAASLVPERVTEIYLRDNELLRDLTGLAALPRLAHVALANCPSVTDLGPLAGLPVTHLSLNSMPGLERSGALAPLSGSTDLSSLDVGMLLRGGGLDRPCPGTCHCASCASRRTPCGTPGCAACTASGRCAG